MNILLTSVGRRGYLVQYFKEALNGRGLVHVSNSTNITPAFSYADKSVVTPLIYDSEYIDFLINYCKEQDISAIISLFDVDLPVLARNKKKFLEQGIKVIVSDLNVINICNDKWNTYKFLTKNHIRCPQTYLSVEEAEANIKNKTLDFPLIVKPRWGMGSIAVFVAANIEELDIFYKKVKRDIQNSYLKYEAACDLEHSVIIQEMLRGQEYGLDIINDLEGQYQNTVVKLKYAMRSGETDCAKTVDSPVLRKLGGQLSDLMRHIGNLDCDVFIVDGAPFVLEMNARFGGGYPFSHAAGVDLPLAIVQWLKGEYINSDILEADYNILSHKDIAIKLIEVENEKD